MRTGQTLIEPAVRAALDELPERDRQVLELRYGIGCRDHTLEEVGRIFGLTRERIRQIEKVALKQLRLRAPDLELYLR